MRAGGGSGWAGSFAAAVVAARVLAAAFLSASLLFPFRVGAQQYQPPAQSLNISGTSASTWTAPSGESVVQLDGPVSIDLDHTHLEAKQAVVWIRDVQGGQPGEQAVSVSLLGDALLQQPEIKRTGDRLYVTGRVNGPIRIVAQSRLARDLSGTQIYRDGVALRSEIGEAGATTEPTGPPPLARPTTVPTSRSTSQPTTRHLPLYIHADTIEETHDADGKIAIVLSGHAEIARVQPSGEQLELQADHAIIFTPFEHLHDVITGHDMHFVEEAVSAAYLEGDVRINMTPSADSAGKKGEQRLEATRVYYDFTTDRAVLTHAIINSYDPQRGIPMIVRARLVRQLSEGEYKTEHAQMTTSGFAVPSYSINAEKAYVQTNETGDPRYGTRTTFVGSNVTLNAFNLPFFYFPTAGATVTERGMPIQGISIGHNNVFGTEFKTRWGLFESMGQIPPPDVDASYRLDYFDQRGPAAGLDAKYDGGIISDETKKAWNFKGDFESYFVNDHGIDDLGRKRNEIPPPEEFRGYVQWEHQQYFPDDWQLQLRTAWVSDVNFMEQWFPDDFNTQLPMETSLYLKRQRDTEAITFLTTVQPNNIVTTSDLVQEQFEVEKVPELGYYRIGDAIADDKATFFSANTLDRLSFQVSGANEGEQGYKVKRGVSPGQPSLGLVGVSGADGPPNVPETYTDRADFRQEVDFPLQAGQFKVVPYLFGRYTGYTDSPDGEGVNRGFVGGGVRVNTQFWRVDDTAQSDLLDIHRMRHIIEPEVNLFTSASNVDPNQLFIYDENVDKTWDVSAVQLALHQRWQTKRGGPGRERSVDVFTLNVSATFYTNNGTDQERIQDDFRGLFFTSAPEASIPRDSINADASWRISDSTLLTSDVAENTDKMVLATASVGVIAQRAERTQYYLGLRYIDDLDSAIGTVIMNYEISTKYSIGIRESYDFNGGDVFSSFSVQRRFDRFLMLFSIYNDSTTGQNGFNFGFFPQGLSRGLSSEALDNSFNKK